MVDTVVDVAVVGAGPVGCVAALAFARKGARVVLIEPNPEAKARFAGELLHPAAVRVLREVGVEALAPADDHPHVRGFAVFSPGAASAMVLDYPDGHVGWTFEFNRFVEALRARAVAAPSVCYLPHHRVDAVDGQRLTLHGPDGQVTVEAGQIIAADGRFSAMRRMLEIPQERVTLSHMCGVALHGVTLPNEGYGHVILGGPGPLLAYRIEPDTVRLVIDVPTAWRKLPDRNQRLWEAYGPHLPEAIREPLRQKFEADDLLWAVAELKPRTRYGRPGAALIGDAVGHFHPMTACGMLLGFEDAIAAANANSFAEYEATRRRTSETPALLATALHEIFSLDALPAEALRHAVFDMWTDAEEVGKTMAYLGGLETDVWKFFRSGARMVGGAGRHVARHAWQTGDWRGGVEAIADIVTLVRWLVDDSLPSALQNHSGSKPITPFAKIREAQTEGGAARTS